MWRPQRCSHDSFCTSPLNHSIYSKVLKRQLQKYWKIKPKVLPETFKSQVIVYAWACLQLWAVGCVIINFSRKNLLAPIFLCLFMYIIQGRKKNHIFWSYLLNFGLQICLDPLIRQKKNVLFMGFMVLKMTGLSSLFQCKNRLEKYLLSPKILAKMTQNIKFWFGDLNLGTFWPISQDQMHIFQNRFLRWNRELKPVVLSTMKPINETKNFLPYKRVQANL